MTKKFSIFNFQFSKILLVTLTVVFLSAGCGKGKPGFVDQNIVQGQIQVRHKVENIDTGEQVINFSLNENKTALDLLKSVHAVETQDFGTAGQMVVSINGAKADSAKEFWAFYVNGKLSNLGASQYRPQNGDRIEWKVEKINPNL